MQKKLLNRVVRVKSRLSQIGQDGRRLLANMDSDQQSGQPKFGTEEWKAIRDRKMLEWFDGDASAVEFMVAISEIAELWDDLIDKDKELTKAEIDSAMFTALVTLPCNQFFNANKQFLMPLILQSINSWQDSVELEKGGESDRAYALTLRMMSLQLCSMIVMLKKGYHHARDVSLEIWRFATAHDDPMKWIKG